MCLIKWGLRLLFAFVAISSTSAFAVYSLVAIDCPGATDTETFGINNAGTVIATCFDVDVYLGTFTYDSKKGTFDTVPISPPTGTVGIDGTGINEKGEVVGFVFVSIGSTPSYIRSNKGVYTTFMHPGSSVTEARANNDNGLVAGTYLDDAAGAFFGFLYDAKSNSFATPGDLVPNSSSTIAQGVNNKGEVVGSADLPAGVACTGCAEGQYGFLRDKTGALTYFQVNGAPTAARGITDSGVIAGWIGTPQGGQVGFVTTLTASPQFQSITIPAAQLLSYPGAIETSPEAIANDGTIVGIWVDADFNAHGFIATAH